MPKPASNDPGGKEIRDRIMQSLPVELTVQELLLAGKKLADEERAIEKARKDAVASFKAQTDPRRAKIRVLSTMIATGVELRLVECDVVADSEKGTLTITRCDTGALVEEGPLSDIDRAVLRTVN